MSLFLPVSGTTEALIHFNKAYNERNLSNFEAGVETEMEFELHVLPHSHMDLGWLDTYEGYSTSKIGSK